MLLTLCAALAVAGGLYVPEHTVEGVGFVEVAKTPDSGGTLVSWPGRPLEIVLLADLSASVRGSSDVPFQMTDTMLAAYDALRTEAVPGDRLGVTAYADQATRWVPLSDIEDEGLRERLASFGPPGDVCRKWHQRRDKTAPPDRCAVGTPATVTHRALKTALHQLRGRDRHDALEVIIVLTDGGHQSRPELSEWLARAEKRGVPVFTIGYKTRRSLKRGYIDYYIHRLITRGGGDAYAVDDYAAMAMRHIIEQLRFPEEYR